MPDFTIYSSKRSDNVRAIEENLIGGDKSWEYVIVPKAPGQQTVPSFTFSYFDPQRAAYETVTTPPLELKVIRSSDDGSVLTGLSGISKQNLSRQGTDINFIKLSSNDLEAQARADLSDLLVLPGGWNSAALQYRRFCSTAGSERANPRTCRWPGVDGPGAILWRG